MAMKFLVCRLKADVSEAIKVFPGASPMFMGLPLQATTTLSGSLTLRTATPHVPSHFCKLERRRRAAPSTDRRLAPPDELGDDLRVRWDLNTIMALSCSACAERPQNRKRNHSHGSEMDTSHMERPRHRERAVRPRS